MTDPYPDGVSYAPSYDLGSSAFRGPTPKARTAQGSEPTASRLLAGVQDRSYRAGKSSLNMDQFPAPRSDLSARRFVREAFVPDHDDLQNSLDSVLSNAQVERMMAQKLYISEQQQAAKVTPSKKDRRMELAVFSQLDDLMRDDENSQHLVVTAPRTARPKMSNTSKVDDQSPKESQGEGPKLDEDKTTTFKKQFMTWMSPSMQEKSNEHELEKRLHQAEARIKDLEANLSETTGELNIWKLKYHHMSSCLTKTILCMPPNTVFPKTFSDVCNQFVSGFIHMFSEIPAYHQLNGALSKAVANHHIVCGLCIGIGMECAKENMYKPKDFSEGVTCEFVACNIPNNVDPHILAIMTLKSFSEQSEDTDVFEKFTAIATELAKVVPRLDPGFDGCENFLNLVQSTISPLMLNLIHKHIRTNYVQEIDHLTQTILEFGHVATSDASVRPQIVKFMRDFSDVSHALNMTTEKVSGPGDEGEVQEVIMSSQQFV